MGSFRAHFTPPVQLSNITALVRLSDITAMLPPTLPPIQNLSGINRKQYKVHKGTFRYIKPTRLTIIWIDLLNRINGCQIAFIVLEALGNLIFNCISVRSKFIFKTSKLCIHKFVLWGRVAVLRIRIYLIRIHKGRPSYKRSLQLSNENIQHFKTWNLQFFLLLCVTFALLDPDPDSE